jgi:hypothetical protein
VRGFFSNTGNWIITGHKYPPQPRLFYDQRTSTSRKVVGNALATKLKIVLNLAQLQHIIHE